MSYYEKIVDFYEKEYYMGICGENTIEEKCYLVSPNGILFCSINKEELDNLERMVWISYCPVCGEIESFHTTEEEAKKDSRICDKCYMNCNFKMKYKSNDYQRIRFNCLKKSIKEYKGITYPCLELL